MKHTKENFKIGQIVRFKNYKRHEKEKEAYFVVIQEKKANNELVIYTINSNRYYQSGTTMEPIFPEEDLQIIDLRPSDLINERITIKETIYNDEVIGKVCFFNSDNHSVHFIKKRNTLISDALFEFDINCKNRLIGPMFIELNTKNIKL